ncbi:MAG: DnaA/Hda family protein [Thermoplasmatales archaeon]|nr:DnaA/Hda family protein [Thermoplasmatales archaeon]
MKKIIVILIVSCFFFSFTSVHVSAEEVPEISNVRVSNPSASSVTISWVTGVGACFGRIDYGTTQDLPFNATDTNLRANGVIMIPIVDLAQDTQYYYRITASNDNGQDTVTGTFKTAKPSTGGAECHVYGQIIKKDYNPADSTMVYVTVEHHGQKSQYLSEMTNSEGYWEVDLRHLKDNNGEVFQYFQGDTLKIEAQGGTLGYGCKGAPLTATGTLFCSQIFLGTPEPEKEQTLWDKLSEYKILLIGASAVIILIGIVFAARKKMPKVRRVKKTPAEISEEPGLFEEYTFDNFVIGSSNKFAADAALTVAKKPGIVYNPLLIYADVGIGKTHLLNAIGNYVKEHYPEKNVKYISSEKLIYEFTASGKDKTMAEKLKNVYRNVDVLLIDDIQFLADKPAAQEEFFHTFNTLFLGKKQIVLACDRPPKDIPSLDDRLKSRFEGGLVTHILDPEIETRIIILKRDAEKNGMKIDFEVLYYIASNCNSNVRNVKGGLTRVMAYAKIHSEEITIGLAKKALGEPESVEMKFG